MHHFILFLISSCRVGKVISTKVCFFLAVSNCLWGQAIAAEAQVSDDLNVAPLSKLTPLSDHLDSTPSWQAGYRFGSVKILDILPAYNGKEVPSLTHTFVFTNAGPTPIVISDMVSDCSCTKPNIDETDFRGLPYTVPSGRDIRVTVTLDPRQVSGGQITRTVNLLKQDQETPVATMTMQGLVINGVSVSDGEKEEKIVKLRAVPQGIEQRRQVLLTLDRRLPLYFKNDTLLRFVTTDPNFALTPKFGSAPQGVEFDEDIVKVVKSGTPWPKDLVLRYELRQLETTPPGKIDARLVLAVNKEPEVKMLHRISVPLQGYVVGRKLKTPPPTEKQATDAP